MTTCVGVRSLVLSSIACSTVPYMYRSFTTWRPLSAARQQGNPKAHRLKDGPRTQRERSPVDGRARLDHNERSSKDATTDPYRPHLKRTGRDESLRMDWNQVRYCLWGAR